MSSQLVAVLFSGESRVWWPNEPSLALWRRLLSSLSLTPPTTIGVEVDGPTMFKLSFKMPQVHKKEYKLYLSLIQCCCLYWHDEIC